MESEMLPWTEYSHFAVSLFAILTPFSAVPAPFANPGLQTSLDIVSRLFGLLFTAIAVKIIAAG